MQQNAMPMWVKPMHTRTQAHMHTHARKRLFSITARPCHVKLVDQWWLFMESLYTTSINTVIIYYSNLKHLHNVNWNDTTEHDEWRVFRSPIRYQLVRSQLHTPYLICFYFYIEKHIKPIVLVLLVRHHRTPGSSPIQALRRQSASWRSVSGLHFILYVVYIIITLMMMKE